MEPVCYLMTLGNFSFGYFFYLMMKKDLELTNVHDIMAYRMSRSASKRQGIDLELHEEQKSEL
jgi:hypothetical protein